MGVFPGRVSIHSACPALEDALLCMFLFIGLYPLDPALPVPAACRAWIDKKDGDPKVVRFDGMEKD